MVSSETLRLSRGKGNFGSSPRFTTPSSLSTPGPGGYDSSTAYQKTVKKSGAGTSLGKSPRFAVRSKSALSPGPGQYAATQESSFSGKTPGGGSSTFRSTTPRLAETKTVAPGPGQYVTDPKTPVKESKSTGKRFQEYVTPSPGPAAYDTTAEPQRPQSASSVFKSSVPRLPESKSEAPGVGAYESQNHLSIDKSLQNVSLSAHGRTASMGKSERFEKYITASPGPAAYELKEEQKKGFAPMRSTSERFLSNETPVPGPGQYVTNPETPVKESKSTGKRFQEYVTPSPGPAAYDTTAEPQRPQSASSVFKSTVERFADIDNGTPGPASYNMEDVVNVSVDGAVSMQNSTKGPAPMSAKAPRFEEKNNSIGPGPGAHFNERALDIIYSPTIR